MDSQITYAQYQEMFRKDADGCYVHLVIPGSAELPPLDLSGKRPEDYTVDETIRMKKYAGKMFQLVDKSTM